MLDTPRLSPTHTVSAHGARMPVIGFGTGWMSADCVDFVAAALRAGYRHIDTARKYGTERGVGEAIRASRIPREELSSPPRYRTRTCARAISRARSRPASRSSA
jgi:predicted aldo/keto reductase-like oxidoreductase